ncbi:MAG TPA: ATPase [Planctomycetaceae bacterium]|nr:ATPase [Planctomycetaceae bacterium]
MKCFCGIDIGASSTKLVLIDEDARIVGKSIRRSGVNYAEASERCLAEALESARVDRNEIVRSLSTGYGRDNVPWSDGKRTEIACHGKGAYESVRGRLTVIDIGAQDSKPIHLDEQGRRINFKMNRKCAAGTGAFLEEIALRLDLPVERLNGLAEHATKDVSLGSFCTVFAATEVLSLIRQGETVENIAKGAFHSVVKRIIEMGAADGQLVMTGGVAAHNPLLVQMVGRAFGQDVFVPPHAQFVGAFGAALFARDESE